MKIIAIANQKGGVSKTSSAVNIAAALTKMKKKILLLDLDSQANSSSWLLGQRAADGSGIYEVIVKKADILKHTKKSECGIDVVPANAEMASLDLDMIEEMNREHRLTKALSKVRDRYDYVLMDCPPALGLIVINALVAADSVIIPIDCRPESYAATSRLLSTIERVVEETEKTPSIFALPTFVERTRIATEVMEAVKKKFENMLPPIRKSTRIPESYAAHQSIFDYDPNALIVEDFKAVARKLCQEN